MTTNLFHARDQTITLQSSITYDGTAEFSTLFGSGTDIYTKATELNEGEIDFDQQNYTGEDANGYQNQEKVHKPKGPGELKLTLDYDNLSAVMALLYDSSTSAGSGSYTTYDNGNAVRKTVAALVKLDTGSDSVAFIVDNAEQVTPTTKLTSVDGQFEYELTLKCLAKDLHGPQFPV